MSCRQAGGQVARSETTSWTSWIWQVKVEEAHLPPEGENDARIRENHPILHPIPSHPIPPYLLRMLRPLPAGGPPLPPHMRRRRSALQC